MPTKSRLLNSMVGHLQRGPDTAYWDAAEQSLRHFLGFCQVNSQSGTFGQILEDWVNQIHSHLGWIIFWLIEWAHTTS